MEFRNVYIVGMEENLFPSQMMITSRADLEEERRLFYVAITRAEKKLTLSYATSRYQWGNLRSCEKSRFLDEIDPAFVDFKFAAGGGPGAGDIMQPHVFERRSNLVATPPRKTVATKYVAPADFAASDTKNLQTGAARRAPQVWFRHRAPARSAAGHHQGHHPIRGSGRKSAAAEFRQAAGAWLRNPLLSSFFPASGEGCGFRPYFVLTSGRFKHWQLFAPLPLAVIYIMTEIHTLPFHQQLLVREYGHSTYQLILGLKDIEDVGERTKRAAQIVQLMLRLQPGLRDQTDVQTRLWNHLHALAGDEVALDAPVPLRSMSRVYEKPARVPYPVRGPKLRAYGASRRSADCQSYNLGRHRRAGASHGANRTHHEVSVPPAQQGKRQRCNHLAPHWGAFGRALAA